MVTNSLLMVNLPRNHMVNAPEFSSLVAEISVNMRMCKYLNLLISVFRQINLPSSRAR
jgi:hypothetical protein